LNAIADMARREGFAGELCSPAQPSEAWLPTPDPQVRSLRRKSRKKPKWQTKLRRRVPRRMPGRARGGQRSLLPNEPSRLSPTTARIACECIL